MIEAPLQEYMASKEGQDHARAYLSSAKPLEALIGLKLSRLDVVRAQGQRVTRAMDSLPAGGGRGDKVGDAAVTLADMEDELLADYHRLIERQSELAHHIRRIPDAAARTVLELRFLHGLSMQGIAFRMEYDVRQVQRIQKRGLERIAGWIFTGLIELPPDVPPMPPLTPEMEAVRACWVKGSWKGKKGAGDGAGE